MVGIAIYLKYLDQHAAQSMNTGSTQVLARVMFSELYISILAQLIDVELLFYQYKYFITGKLIRYYDAKASFVCRGVHLHIKCPSV